MSSARAYQPLEWGSGLPGKILSNVKKKIVERIVRNVGKAIEGIVSRPCTPIYIAYAYAAFRSLGQCYYGDGCLKSIVHGKYGLFINNVPGITSRTEVRGK